MSENKICRKCGVKLIEDNWCLSHKKHPEYICISCQKKYRKEYYQKNKKLLIQKRKIYLKNLRKQVLQILGNKCVKCGLEDYRVLQIDHIHGGGNKEYKKIGYISIYCKIIRLKEKAKEKYCLHKSKSRPLSRRRPGRFRDGARPRLHTPGSGPCRKAQNPPRFSELRETAQRFSKQRHALLEIQRAIRD